MKIIKAFLEDKRDIISEYSRKFAKKMVNAILSENENEMKTLIKKSSELRDDLEFQMNIKRDSNFYFGYLFAYENIARNIIDNKVIYDVLKKSLKDDERLKKIMKFMDEEEIVTQKEIAICLEIKSNTLANYLNKDQIKKLDLFSKIKSGRNVFYSLNRKGKEALEILNNTNIDINRYLEKLENEEKNDTYSNITKNKLNLNDEIFAARNTNDTQELTA